MLKVKKWECKNCRWEFLQWILLKNNWFCNNCYQLPKENKIIKPKEEVKTSDDFINWLPLYSLSYLNNKLKKNLNSIKKQTCCIEYKWKYILHEDIINQFKNSLQE